MPVVNFSIDRLTKFFPGMDLTTIVELLPFVALDIESITSEFIRVEYNPNRPDFASEYGIVRALRGLAGIETGIPKFAMYKKKKDAISSQRRLISKRVQTFNFSYGRQKEGEH